MKRNLLFLATNMAIVLVLMRLLGVEPYLNENGLNLTSLLIFAAVMGFGGSFISLAIFKWMAKKTMGVRVSAAVRSDPGLPAGHRPSGRSDHRAGSGLAGTAPDSTSRDGRVQGAKFSF